MQQTELRAALDGAGYRHVPATPTALRECFLDYVDAGYWGDLTLEDANDGIEIGEITEIEMIRALRGRRTK